RSNNAIEANALYDVNINIGGAGAAITTDTSTDYGVYSVVGFAIGGDVNINNDEASPYIYGIAAISYTGNAVAARAYSPNGTSTITGDGDFFAVVTGNAGN